MSRFMRRIYKREEGFTLIELLFAITILGILALLAIPRMANFTETAKQKTHEANRRTLMSAASMWYAQNADQMSDNQKVWTGADGEGWEDYLQEWPDNPLGTEDYEVTIYSNGKISVTPEPDSAESDGAKSDSSENEPVTP